MIDRELYLPRSWTDDPERLQAAGVPDQVGFATKPALATAMICRALDAGFPAAWVAGDEVDGANPKLRAELEARGIGYVLAVACDDHVGFGGVSRRADALLGQVPARAWQQVSCGKGAKGHRDYDWAFLRLDHDGPAPCEQAGQHWLMIRPSWSGSPGGAGRWRSVNHSALICANWLHDLRLHCGRAARGRSSGDGCTSQAGECGAGGARRGWWGSASRIQR